LRNLLLALFLRLCKDRRRKDYAGRRRRRRD